MRIIDGKKLANKILKKLKKEIRNREIKPGLAVILVGDDPASLLYVKNKKRAAEKIGVKFEVYKYSANITNEMLITRIKNLNKQKSIQGIIVQLPLPKHLNTNKIISAIDPKKDIDGFRPNSRHISPVAQAVVALIEAAKNKLKDNKAILFVKSEIFAKPIKEFLEKRGVKVQTVLFTTPSILPLLKGGGGRVGETDIVVTALGKPHILKSEMIKNGAVVIDVGITKVENPPCPAGGGAYSPFIKGGDRGGFEFIGDFDPTGSEKKKGFYTPVPGGVGPMTVVMLLKNVIKAAETRH